MRGMNTSATSGIVRDRQRIWRVGANNVQELPTHRTSKSTVGKGKVYMRPRVQRGPWRETKRQTEGKEGDVRLYMNTCF